MNRDPSADAASLVPETTTIGLVTAAEIDQQIATAKRYPRSIEHFRQKVRQLACQNEKIAAQCMYELPRDGKTVRGPSIRFAEILLSCWGNTRTGARVIEEGREFVVAQGIFHDLESNSLITSEARRRILTKKGERYGVDMIGTTSNAACSIALRNAVRHGVPEAYWADLFAQVQQVIKGDAHTYESRVRAALDGFAEIKVNQHMVCELIGVRGVRDITIDHLVSLAGILTALKEGDTTVEDILAQNRAANGESGGVEQPRERAKNAAAPGATEASSASGSSATPPAGDGPSQPAEGAAASAAAATNRFYRQLEEDDQQQVVGGSRQPDRLQEVDRGQVTTTYQRGTSEGAAGATEQRGGPPPVTRPITPGQIKMIRASLARASLTDLDVQAKFGCTVEELHVLDLGRVQAWIAQRAGA